jgi:catechol 2,3-dioxygenase-like lactoylglutathione lyase family enzyme
MIDLQGIDHVCLLISDLKKSKIYYEKLFNIVCKPHPNDATTLMVESPFVHFFIKEINAPQSFLGYQHLSFKVPTLGVIIRELEMNNISYETGTFTYFTNSKYRWVEWRDLNGIRLECIEAL